MTVVSTNAIRVENISENSGTSRAGSSGASSRRAGG